MNQTKNLADPNTAQLKVVGFSLTRKESAC